MDIYDIAVKLALTGGLSGALRGTAGQFTRLRGDISRTTAAVRSFQSALRQSVEWGAGTAILRGMGDIIAAGGQIANQQALMLAAGYQQAKVAQMTATAYREAARVMAATPASALAAERTLLGIFGNVAEAQAALNPLLKAEAVLYAQGRGAGAESNLAYGIKTLDIQGAFIRNGKFDLAAYQSGLHELMALLLAVPHTLDLRQLFQFTRMAGPAAEAMSFQDYARTYGEVVASMGRTGGRGLQQLYHTLLGGNVSKALAQELIAAGVVTPGAIHHIKGSSRDILDYHGIVGYQERTKNAADWAHDVLFPLLEKRGMGGVPGLMQALGAMPITAQRLLSFFLTNWAQIERGKETVERAENAASYDQAAAKSWRLQIANFEKAWLGLEQALGSPLVGPATHVINAISGALKELTDLLGDNPWAADILDGLAGAVGVILAAAAGRMASMVAFRTFAFAMPRLAAALGLFADGTAAAGGIAALASGLPELAAGLVLLGSAVFTAFDLTARALAQHPLKTAEPLKKLNDKMERTREEGEWRMTHGGSLAGFHYTPEPVPRRYRYGYAAVLQDAAGATNPLPLAPPAPPAVLPLPPLAPVHVTLNSPISLPMPPLSPGDIESLFRRAIYSHNSALLHELAAAVVRQQQSELLPVIEDAIGKIQARQRRQTLLDHAGGYSTH